ncbi:MAG: LysM peptidoglycan-binding domain-containing protein [Planctomycetes bacterium]|nr:LysM peptidoglycan-binding domain-containing protein [Planctomycetota bacterium]
MRKDLKMGMITGVVIVTVATGIISVLSPTPEAMLIEESSMLSPQGEQAEIIRVIGPEDTAPPDAADVIIESEKKRYSAGPKIHVVKAGETLSSIAQKYYGTTDGQQTIVDANGDSILDADALRVGTRLVIP